MLTAFFWRCVIPPFRFDRDLFFFLAFGACGNGFFPFGSNSRFLAFGACGNGFFPFRSNNRFLAFGADDDCTRRFGTPFLPADDRRGTVAGSMPRTVIKSADDLVAGRRRGVARPRRRRPSRRFWRTEPRSDPAPVMVEEEPSLVIRDVFILVQDVVVLRDERLSGGRHDHCFLHDPRGRFHDDRRRERFEDRADQIHDVSGKPDAVRRRLVVIAGEGRCRSEDNRRGECGADSECPVDRLLDCVSFW